MKNILELSAKVGPLLKVDFSTPTFANPFQDVFSLYGTSSAIHVLISKRTQPIFFKTFYSFRNAINVVMMTYLINLTVRSILLLTHLLKTIALELLNGLQ